MSHPTDDDLVDLVLGESVDPESAAHVAGCPTCSASVEQLRRTVHLASSPGSYAAWQAPDDAVWDRVAAQIEAEQPTAAEGDAPGQPAPPLTESHRSAAVHPFPLPVVPPVVPPEPPESPETEGETLAPPTLPPSVTAYEPRHVHGAARRPSRRRAAAWAGALVAASLAVGLLTGRAIWSPDEGGRVSQVALTTLDTRQREGEATVIRAGAGLDLHVTTDRPLDAGDGYLEVWLINADGKRMVSVGVLRPGESDSFPITQSLIDQGYVVVDISQEQFDDKPAHSGDSLLRGRLPA